MAKQKNYLLKFAKEMDWLGKYTFKNQTELNKIIGEATKLTDDEKRVARKAIEDVLAARLVFDKYGLIMRDRGLKQTGFPNSYKRTWDKYR